MKKDTKKVALATDFSYASGRATSTAKWFQSLGVELCVVHIFDEESLRAPLPYASEASKINEKLIESYRKKGTKAFEDLKEEFAPNTDFYFLEGTPGDELLKFVDEHKIDLLVMGTHGHTGWNRMILGSVSDYVLRHTSCGVLTIKPEDRE